MEILIFLGGPVHLEEVREMKKLENGKFYIFHTL